MRVRHPEKGAGVDKSTEIRVIVQELAGSRGLCGTKTVAQTATISLRSRFVSLPRFREMRCEEREVIEGFRDLGGGQDLGGLMRA